jgi:hypothetical protein
MSKYCRLSGASAFPASADFATHQFSTVGCWFFRRCGFTNAPVIDHLRRHPPKVAALSARLRERPDVEVLSALGSVRISELFRFCGYPPANGVFVRPVKLLREGPDVEVLAGLRRLIHFRLLSILNRIFQPAMNGWLRHSGAEFPTFVAFSAPHAATVLSSTPRASPRPVGP